MTAIAREGGALAPARGPDARSALFVVAMVLVLVSLRPYEDLGKADVLDITTGRDVYLYLALGLISAACVTIVYRHDRPALRALVRWPYIALGACICVCSLFSFDPSTSIRRALLTLFVIVTAAALPLLPAGAAQLAKLLAVVAGVVLAMSYFGVIFLPELSVHQAFDIAEPDLAGDWRGVYVHKNVAGAAFGILAFFGAFVYRARQQILGLVIFAGALVFLLFTHSKTSTSLWLPAFLLAFVPYSRIWAMLALAPLFVINVLGVGAQAFPFLKPIANALPFDSTFTGRTELWALTIKKILAKPVLGYGFDAFWNNSDIRYNTELGWVAGAANAHNSYVDAALGTGLIGMGLFIVAAIAMPLRDIAEASRRGADPALLTLFTQIWLFGCWAASLESFFFDRADPVWFIFLMAIFGLRYLATFRTTP